MADSSSQGDSTPRAVEGSGSEDQAKGKKRSLFGFGKKKTGSSKSESKEDSAPTLLRESSKLSSATQSTELHTTAPSSPRALSTSPRLTSPAHSQIFERDVQDSTIPQDNSSAIPTHIQTENHIPPVLDDASEAITNNKLDPDAVEIVTHNSHQPAALTVAATSPISPLVPFELPSSTEWADELNLFTNRQANATSDNASNYGSLDSADVRRLSFISFADVVQSEHGVVGGASSRDSIHLAGLTSLPSALNRSPSPIRSPVSSQGPGTSPPTSNPGSVKGVEMSPSRKPLGSPKSGSQNLNMSGELNIETMSQALRRTGSSDFSNFRSIPTSPVEEVVSR
ncbi:hypothetical protein V2G26_003032 [Clonostachys chloroleuca]|uniref:Uncharacterized protein n=1 Tax=Clonostachys chloroleuca TaxID=1926264 RepID=A0AA35MIJ8_9HYPO|nr:unnamed protein product [Clonostachys chloroleuca]